MIPLKMVFCQINYNGWVPKISPQCIKSHLKCFLHKKMAHIRSDISKEGGKLSMKYK
jgi:hypothetical protein